MSDRLKDIPLEGKVVRIKEDTVWGGFGRQNMRITLIIKNEIFGVNQHVSFVRPGEGGDILTTLINDFKDGKEINVKGRISYSLYNPGGSKELSKNVKHLKDTTDWKKISEDDKKALKVLLGMRIAPYWGEMVLEVSVENKVKYLICADEGTVAGADIYLQ